MEEFRSIFEEDTPSYKSYCTITKEILESEHFSQIDKKIRLHSWDEIQPLLYRAVQKIEVKSINGSSGDSLTYYENEKDGISVIAIGGDKLSRGLTLEGLSVSYFLRASKMYDTLMQMGRWFGYRPGYVDLCRLFTSSELNEWYRHISLASEELREEFRYLSESGGTPDDYSLKVRTHPGQLQITSVTKMRHAQKVEVSWAGRLMETYQLCRHIKDKKANLDATDELLSKLGMYEIDKRNNYFWKNVPADTICDYFSQFRLPKSLTKVPMDRICEYIRLLNKHGELISWSVALMSRSISTSSNRKAMEYTFLCGIKARCFMRNQAEDIDDKCTYYIRKNHIVGDQRDEFIDLSQDLIGKALTRTKKLRKKWNKPYPAPDIVRQEFRPKEAPLLIIYPLDPAGSNKDDKQTRSRVRSTNNLSEDPYIGLAISFPSSKTNYAVSYVVNQVGNFEETENIFDEYNDNNYEG